MSQRPTATGRYSGPLAERAGGPVVVLGGTGMLGRAWRELLAARGIESVAPGRGEIDFSKPPTMAGVERLRARAVINCAAYTRVDDAETHEAEARVINAESPGELARVCTRMGAALVHYSTDYVFDGEATRPYGVDAATRPLNAYGRTKLEGERRVLAEQPEALVIRASWLYAAWGGNFVRTIVSKAREQRVLRVVDDQRGRPSSAVRLAETSLRLMEAGAGGIVHAADEGDCTWFEFAREIVRVSGLACEVQACTSAEFPRPAKRPGNSVLDLSATHGLIGAGRDWRENLAEVMAAMADGPGRGRGS